MARLLTSEQVSGTTNFEVLHGDLHSGTELIVRGDRIESFVGGFAQRLLFVIQEVRVGALTTTPHSTTQLVQLAKAVLVGSIDDERVRVGDVEPGLHDRGGDEHIKFAIPEVDHHLLKGRLGHLAVGDRDASIRNQFGNLGGNPVDGTHPVVHVKDLPLSQKLAADRRANLTLRVGPDKAQDRMPIFGRSSQSRHLADARDSHLQGARNRGCRHRQDVDVGLKFLESILVLNTKALLFVNDDEAEIFETDALREQPVGADDNIHGSVGEPGDRFARLFLRLKTTECSQMHGEPGKAVGKGLHVLANEQGRWHDHGDLFTVLNSLERGPNGNFSLSVSHITAEQPVHRNRALHVSFHFIDRRELIRSFGVSERLF